MGFGQFLPQILPLQEQANRARACESNCIAQQPGQRGTGPAGDDVKGLGRSVFHTGVQYPDIIQLHARRRRREEGAFLGGGFVQGHGDIRPHGRQDQPGKASAGAQISQSASSIRDQGCQLGAIPEVALPQFGQGASGHQVMAFVPVGQDVGIGLQLSQCFL